MLAQEKVAKEKATPCRLTSPALLAFAGGNRTRPDKPYKPWLVAELRQVIAEFPAKAELLGEAEGETKSKTNLLQQA